MAKRLGPLATSRQRTTPDASLLRGRHPRPRVSFHIPEVIVLLPRANRESIPGRLFVPFRIAWPTYRTRLQAARRAAVVARVLLLVHRIQLLENHRVLIERLQVADDWRG